MDYKIKPCQTVKGSIQIPGDKSISHRSIIFGSLAEGKTVIRGLLESEDCMNTIKAFQGMGIKIVRNSEGEYCIHGCGLNGLQEPRNVINCGNSGTTMRLLTGLLSAQKFYSVLTGDSSLRKRPMDRVIIPLSKMGASIWGREEKYAPLSIMGQKIKGISYLLPVASAQVKSSILLAGLYTKEPVEVIEPGKSRDHTERMLKGFGVNLIKKDNKIILPNEDKNQLKAQEITVPGDISSAAYFAAAAVLVEDSNLVIKNVGINETRNGILKVLKKMEANIKICNKRTIGGEGLADLKVQHSRLKGITIDGDIIPTLIDEIPIIAVIATQAEGQTIIKDAGELRVKESDRIKNTASFLSKMGADIKELKDGFIINGPTKLKGGLVLDGQNDHRIAMSMAVAALTADNQITIKNSQSINTSFPEFKELIKKVIKYS